MQDLHDIASDSTSRVERLGDALDIAEREFMARHPNTPTWMTLFSARVGKAHDRYRKAKLTAHKPPRFKLGTSPAEYHRARAAQQAASALADVLKAESEWAATASLRAMVDAEAELRAAERDACLIDQQIRKYDFRKNEKRAAWHRRRHVIARTGIPERDFTVRPLMIRKPRHD